MVGLSSATPVMIEDTLLPFDLPSVGRKKARVAFDGGQLSSNGGVLLLRSVERRLDLAARLAGCIRDRRNPESILHTVEEMLRLRMFAIAAGYEDADDCDVLRHDPMFKMALGRDGQGRTLQGTRRARRVTEVKPAKRRDMKVGRANST